MLLIFAEDAYAARTTLIRSGLDLGHGRDMNIYDTGACFRCDQFAQVRTDIRFNLRKMVYRNTIYL